ncbi:MAG: sigma-54-dependent Fis family transcriptional regulator [Myxococcota bacterium]|nr:sigma-54-dependent Fis family transcriptional regulator [Myxococcota bacterium]
MTRLSLLVDLASVLAREVDLDQLLREVADTLAVALRAERASVWLIDADRGDLVTRVAVLPEVEQLRQPLGRGVVGHVAAGGEVLRIDDAAADARFDPSADERTGFQTRSILAVPIREAQGAPVRGVVQVLNRADGPFDAEDERYLVAFGMQLGRALALTTLRADDASGPGLSLRGPFNRIVGRGPAMDAVYERVLLAAGTDATVLLRGETGTGKTLLARAIHVNSPRSEGPFVTVDCTTLPRELVESELFGHERGAFTGAERRVAGRVERADGGTLFLDEIGDLPPEAQGKLLRFLQDRAFERVGGREELSSDCRVLCATHHDLERLVEEGRFRRDLYYRVRVVQVDVPSLAARGRGEIERLARHFADLYAARYGRPEPRFGEAALEALLTHGWPGNVRELEHWIESAIVLAPDGVVRASAFPERPPGASSPATSSGGARGVVIPHGLTANEARDAYIRATVDDVEGNKSEAARRLAVSRNTVARALSE